MNTSVSPASYVCADDLAPSHSIFDCFANAQALYELEHTLGLKYSEEEGFVLDATGFCQMRILLLSVMPMKIKDTP